MQNEERMNDKQNGKQKRFISLRAKLVVGFTLLFSVIFVGAFYWFDNFAQNLARQRIKDDLIKTVQSASVSIDGDELIALFKEGVPNESGFSDDPRYKRQLKYLDELHTADKNAWFYTFVAGDKPGEVIFITDLAALYEPDKAAKFLEISLPAEGEDESNCTVCRGLRELTMELTPYEDKWGTWVSGYAPITNSKGEKVAALGVDYSTQYVNEFQNEIRQRVLTVFILTYSLMMLMVLLVSRALTRPILVLTEAAGRIGEGDYEQDLSTSVEARFPDEINSLARVFELMVSKVYKREQTLRRQVEELRIEIDEVKRKKQVSEIVESDFFQDLQVKARSMRGRGRKGGEGQEASGDTP